jgi:hypothetical protein
MKQIQNSPNSLGKSIPAYGFKKSQEKIHNPKVSRLLPNICDLHKKIGRLGYGFKNL